ncbi:hypothetical protein CNMCM5793_000077 [Aspergillus hiratsukae]|uniref:Uncharacterized protein n=1 Tax=Aspergillus hiratsukae TaxID=1194566 RepID=A0A8H6P9M5_9EURO|nr:hypothetical protein CNMCM5793_000077 [Aspergillus hiratsukae]
MENGVPAPACRSRMVKANRGEPQLRQARLQKKLLSPSHHSTTTRNSTPIWPPNSKSRVTRQPPGYTYDYQFFLDEHENENKEKSSKGGKRRPKWAKLEPWANTLGYIRTIFRFWNKFKHQSNGMGMVVKLQILRDLYYLDEEDEVERRHKLQRPRWKKTSKWTKQEARYPKRQRRHQSRFEWDLGPDATTEDAIRKFGPVLLARMETWMKSQ